MTEKNDICLVMIVRDESHVIQRCFNSLINVIDSYLICDTGSEDDTPQIIEEYMKEHNVPGQVIHKEWKNFGYNKSYLLEQAHTENLSNNARYLIWIDADEIFRNEKGEALTSEDKEKLITFLDDNPEAGIFFIETFYAGLRYQRWNLVRNNQLYKWEAPVHEYLVATKPTKNAYIKFITLLARKEGARTVRGDSFQRDIEMFKEYLKEKPNDPRTYFYLAQTYGESGNLPKAIKLYRKRMEMGGYYQEKYIAALRMGRHFKQLKKPDDALRIWSRGMNIVPTRLEIPYEMMLMLFHSKRKDDAYTIGAQAYRFHRLNTSDLFIESYIYDWRFYMELSVVCHYTNHPELAHELGKRLLSEMKYPPIQAKIIETNMDFFRQKLSENKLPPIPKHLSIKFNFHPPAVLCIDDFLPNPDEVRDFALSQKFSVKGNYPGLRTGAFATEDHKSAFEQILGKKITYWPKGDNNYNGSFQITTGRNKSWIHRDLTTHSAIIFLTPDPPPDGGTVIYRHKELKIERDTEGNKENVKQLNDDGSDESKWEVMDLLGNKYNRLILFSGLRSHRSNQYFGSTREDGRLFQIFFFNVET